MQRAMADSWVRQQPREELPAAAPERQRRSQGVTELRRSSLARGASVVVSAGSVLDFGGATDWAPAAVAIVNAANCGGLGGGGVDGAITSAGGPQLAADRRGLPILEGTQMDRIATGGAVLTGPGCYGHLHAGNVIHAVGPNYLVLAGLGQSVEAGDAQLSDAYRATMRAAASANVEYLGFSLLSAGIFRGSQSLEHVLRLGVEAVAECAYPGLKEVHLVAFMVEEQRALLQLLEARDADAAAVVGAEPRMSPTVMALRAEVGSELAGVSHETELLRDEFRDDISDLRKSARYDLMLA
jgi:O-acetyl-ADP-ribose deacetylase (regulator of RNase III)